MALHRVLLLISIKADRCWMLVASGSVTIQTHRTLRPNRRSMVAEEIEEGVGPTYGTTGTGALKMGGKSHSKKGEKGKGGEEKEKKREEKKEKKRRKRKKRKERREKEDFLANDVHHFDRKQGNRGSTCTHARTLLARENMDKRGAKPLSSTKCRLDSYAALVGFNFRLK